MLVEQNKIPSSCSTGDFCVPHEHFSSFLPSFIISLPSTSVNLDINSLSKTPTQNHDYALLRILLHTL